MTTGVLGRLAAVLLFSLFLRQSSLQAHSWLLGRTAQSTRLGIATAMARTLSECQHKGSRGTCESTLALAIQTTTPFWLDLRPRGWPHRRATPVAPEENNAATAAVGRGRG